MNYLLVLLLITCVVVFGLSIWGFVEAFQMANFWIGAGASLGLGLSLPLGFDCVKRLRLGS